MPEEFSTDDLNKQDILQLLEIGLKENQPFARHFAETVLREINRKIRNLEIQTSAIEIDGNTSGTFNVYAALIGYVKDPNND